MSPPSSRPQYENFGVFFLSKKFHYTFHFNLFGWDNLIDDIVNVAISEGYTLVDPVTKLMLPLENATTQLKTFSSGVLACITSIGAYNNYSFSSDLSSSIVEMHIALSLIHISEPTRPY